MNNERGSREKALAHMTAIIHAKAKPKELITRNQPPFCEGGDYCGRDKSGRWHCVCLKQSKIKR